MIDIRGLRNDPDRFLARLARKGADAVGRELLDVDTAWRAATAEAEQLRASQKPKGRPTPEQLEELRQRKELLQAAEAELAELAARRDALLARVPNPPADDVPDGGEDDWELVREWGEPPSFDFEVRDHLELGLAHGWIDPERGAKVSGSRFVYRLGDVALLELALYRWALDRVVRHGHIPMLPPALVREEAMYGTGFFPTDEVNTYGIERDDLYLVGTSEVPLAGFHAHEELEGLPLRYAAYSPCFRREAGAAGKDTRGMFRVHQFDKVEMFVYTTPEASRDEHDRLLALEEELVQELG